jgi:hypothetical protein
MRQGSERRRAEKNVVERVWWIQPLYEAASRSSGIVSRLEGERGDVINEAQERRCCQPWVVDMYWSHTLWAVLPWLVIP